MPRIIEKFRMRTKIEQRVFLLPKYLFLSLLLLLAAHSLSAQKGQKPPKDPQKEALKEQSKKDKELDKKIKKLKKEHKKNQSKGTRKRMKTSAGQSDRTSRNKKDPFFQRLFRNRKLKKIRSEKDK